MLLRRLPIFLLLLALGVLPVNTQNVPSRRVHFSIGGSVHDANDHHEPGQKEQQAEREEHD